MPGANCAFPDCHVTRTKKHKRISIFQIPTRNGESYSGWRKSILKCCNKIKIIYKQADLDERVSKRDVEDNIEFTSK